jgi:hypothetical protein
MFNSHVLVSKLLAGEVGLREFFEVLLRDAVTPQIFEDVRVLLRDAVTPYVGKCQKFS